MLIPHSLPNALILFFSGIFNGCKNVLKKIAVPIFVKKYFFYNKFQFFFVILFSLEKIGGANKWGEGEGGHQ